MANTFTNTSLVAKAALSFAKYATPFIQTTRDYTSFFGSTPKSYKTGVSISVPVPPRYIVGGSVGSATDTFAINDIVESTVTLTIDTYRKIGITVPTQDDALKLTDWMTSVVDPASRSLWAQVEADHLTKVNKIGQAVLAGSTGLDLDDAGEALAILKEQGVPQDKKLMLLAPQTLHSSMVNNQSSLFNPTQNISAQYLEGVMGEAMGFTWASSELLPIHTNGTANLYASATGDGYSSTTGLTPLAVVNDASIASGDTTLVVDATVVGTTFAAYTSSIAAGTITAGTVVEIENVNSINQYTYQSTGRRKRFAIASDVTLSSSAGTLTFTEAFIYGATNSLSNVSALPVDNAAIWMVGKVSTSYKQAIAYHRDAFIRAFCNLTLPSAGAKASQLSRDGMVARVLYTYDHSGDDNIMRLDAFSGNAVGRPEFAVRLLQEI